MNTMKKKLLVLALALFVSLGSVSSVEAIGDVGYPNWKETISCGGHYTAVLKADGSLWMWGGNETGQLGNGGHGNSFNVVFDNVICQTVPIKVMDQVASISCGYEHVAALKKDGSLWMWGLNSDGRLGIGLNGNAVTSYDEPYQTVPVKVMDNVAAVSCGDYHTAAIKTDGTLWTWGSNSSGQLGNGGTGDVGYDTWEGKYYVQTRPVKVMDNVAAVSCGAYHTGIVKTDGTLWMCGNNGSGAVGNGGKGNDTSMIYTYQTVPVQVMSDVAIVSCGLDTTAAVKTDGTLWTWGCNCSGELGNGGREDMRENTWYQPCQSTPLQIMDQVADVSCGQGHTAILKTDGTLWTCGYNSFGKLGDGTDAELRLVPVQVMSQVNSMACGGITTAVVKADGTLLLWGSNENGELGNGTQEALTIPTPLMSGVALRSFAPPVPVAGYTDVWESDYYAKPVEWAVDNGITSGTSDRTFSPHNTCTTAQILTFLWKANGAPKSTYTNPFTDVSEGDYYYQAALWAAENGLVSSGLLDGDSYATRANTMMYLWKLAGKPEAAPANFSDVSANDPYAQAVAWAVQQGITSGTGNTTFSPDSICTRGQIMTFLYRNAII